MKLILALAVVLCLSLTAEAGTDPLKSPCPGGKCPAVRTVSVIRPLVLREQPVVRRTVLRTYEGPGPRFAPVRKTVRALGCR